MNDLRTLLLSWGINLTACGTEYRAKCIAHDDDKQSMSVYINSEDTWIAHCTCGLHEDTVAVQMRLSGQDKEAAEKALESDIVHTGKAFGTITDQPEFERGPRIMVTPEAGHKPPRMDWLIDGDGKPRGEPKEVYAYRSSEGLPIMYEAHYADKRAFFFTYGRRVEAAPPKWNCEAYTPPRPLYGLDKLHELLPKMEAKQVIVCNSGRQAAAAQKLFPQIPCLGYAGKFENSDWSVIRGLPVIIWGGRK